MLWGKKKCEWNSEDVAEDKMFRRKKKTAVEADGCSRSFLLSTLVKHRYGFQMILFSPSQSMGALTIDGIELDNLTQQQQWTVGRGEIIVLIDAFHLSHWFVLDLWACDVILSYTWFCFIVSADLFSKMQNESMNMTRWNLISISSPSQSFPQLPASFSHLPFIHSHTSLLYYFSYFSTVNPAFPQ